MGKKLSIFFLLVVGVSLLLMLGCASEGTKFPGWKDGAVVFAGEARYTHYFLGKQEWLSSKDGSVSDSFVIESYIFVKEPTDKSFGSTDVEVSFSAGFESEEDLYSGEPISISISVGQQVPENKTANYLMGYHYPRGGEVQYSLHSEIEDKDGHKGWRVRSLSSREMTEEEESWTIQVAQSLIWQVRALHLN